MKKFLLSIVVFLSFAVVVNGATVDFTSDNSVVNILDDGLAVKITDVLPVWNEEVLVPVRIAVEAFGANVVWYESEKKVSITAPNIDVSFVVGDNKIIVNESIVELDTPPIIIENRTMVPVQFFEKCMGYKVRVVDITKQIILTNDIPVMRVGDSYIYFDELKLLFDVDKDKYQGEEELLVKSCISNMYDTSILLNNAPVKQMYFTDEDKTEILLKAEENESIYKDTSLKSVYLHILTERKLADKVSDWISNQSIPDDREIFEYFEENFQGNTLTDDLYEEIRYQLGYEKFVEKWNRLYENTDDEMFYETPLLTEMLKQ